MSPSSVLLLSSSSPGYLGTSLGKATTEDVIPKTGEPTSIDPLLTAVSRLFFNSSSNELLLEATGAV